MCPQVVLAFERHRMEIAKVEFFALLTLSKFCPIAIEPEKHKFSDDDFSINSEPILMGPHFSERYLIDL